MGREGLNNQNISVGKKNGVFSSLFRNCEQESPMGKIIDGSVTNT